MEASHWAKWVKNHADFPEDRVSYSVLKELDRSPAEALYKKQNPKPVTPAMEFGAAVDALLCGYEVGTLTTHPDHSSKLTKAFKQAKEEYLATYPKAIYLDHETAVKARVCADVVAGTPFWNQWFPKKDTEFQKHGILEIEVAKGKYQTVANVLDIFRSDIKIICDIKVIADVAPHAFRNQVDRMRWDLQAASYLKMTELIEGGRYDFYWFAIQNDPPFSVQLYEFNRDWYEIAHDDLVRLVRQWHQVKNQSFTGVNCQYATSPVTLQTPPWRRKEIA